MRGGGKLGRGWAPRNQELTASERKDNERAVKALSSMMGGYAGMKAQGVGLEDMSWILEANPKDDLGGIRLLADRMVYDDTPSFSLTAIEEKALPPHVAKYWLIRANRAKELDGNLELTETEDHLALAGLSIATGTQPRRLSDAYRDVADNNGLSTMVIAEIAEAILDDYISNPNPSV